MKISKNSLFTRSNNNQILIWSIELTHQVDHSKIDIKHGIFGGNLVTKSIYIDKGKGNRSFKQQAESEVKARIKSKLQSGYTQLYINDEDILNTMSLLTSKLRRLDSLLPAYKLDLVGMGKPMKGVIFKTNVMSYPAIGQAKINGFRDRCRWETVSEGEGMFATTTEQAVLRSFDGIRYNLPHITNLFTKDMFFDKNGLEVVYDGEIYRPGDKLNEIKKRIPYELDKGGFSNTSLDPTGLGFWIFDLAIPDIKQSLRLEMLDELITTHNITEFSTGVNKFIPQLDLIDIPIVRVSDHIIYNDEQALAFADEAILAGYEGAMIRNSESEYQFGSKKTNMLKVKQWKHTECRVVDIILANEDDNRTYVKFSLANDIVDPDTGRAIFESNCEGDEKQRQLYLNNKQDYIGKLATVRYRERSGVDDVPFQSVVEIVGREDMGDM